MGVKSFASSGPPDKKIYTKFATGSLTSDATQIISVSGLKFSPQTVILYYSTPSNGVAHQILKAGYLQGNRNYYENQIATSPPNNVTLTLNGGPGNYGFSARIEGTSVSVSWFANGS